MCFWMMMKITGLITGESKTEVDEEMTLTMYEPQEVPVSLPTLTIFTEVVKISNDGR